MLLPTLVPALVGKVVTQIAAGAKKSGCVTADGRCYTWGCDIQGQIGVYAPSFLLNFVFVTLNRRYSPLVFE